MPITRRYFPASFKREAVEQVLAGTPLRHVAQAIGVTETLLGKWKRQYMLAGPAFPGQGKQRGEATELKQLRDALTRVTMERDVLKSARHLLGGPEVRFCVIEAGSNRYPIAPLCRYLSGSLHCCTQIVVANTALTITKVC